MDSGENIPGLNEGWTFGGAKAMEWASGLIMAIVIHEASGIKLARFMPIFMIILVGTAMAMAALRKTFPDEERGVANYFMVLMGMAPPGIPAPAPIQPIWSGAPLKSLDRTKEFVDLGLLEVFPHGESHEEDQMDQFNEQNVH
jgi:hypothetical protein